MLSLTVSAMGAHTRADGRPRELSFLCPGMRSGRHIPTTCPNLRNNEILTKAKSDAHELGIMQQWRFCAAGYLHWLEEFEAGRGAPGRCLSQRLFSQSRMPIDESCHKRVAARSKNRTRGLKPTAARGSARHGNSSQRATQWRWTSHALVAAI